MTRDARRTFVILGEHVDLFAALRPALESEMLHVRWARPEDSSEVLDRCVPWPWGIGGMGAGALDGPSQLLLAKPILWFWLGDLPGGSAIPARRHTRWPDLADDVQRCAGRSVGGVRLAPNRGLIGPGGELVLSPALEGLVSSSPAPIRVSTGALRSVSRAIARSGLPVRVIAGRGHARLEAVD